MPPDSSGDSSSAEVRRDTGERFGDREPKKQTKKKKKKSREDRQAEMAREMIARKRAQELATAAGGETLKEGTGERRVIDGDRLPDGKLVKLSDAEQAKFKNVSLWTVGKATAATAALGYLGYKYGKAAAYGFLGYKSLPVVDVVARFLDKRADSMLGWAKRRLPWPLGPLAGGTARAMDWTAKKLGMDKTLFEHLKKNKEDRKKLAEKLLKELRADEKKHESKLDAKEKKKKDKDERDRKRFARLAAKFDPETAHMMVYEMGELDLEFGDDDDEDDKKDDGGEAKAAA